MEIKILHTEKILLKVDFGWYWNKFTFGVESYSYCGSGEFFIHVGFLKIAIMVLTKKSKTENPFDEML